MGGVEVNLNGETSIKNLYAIGEVASTGLHGANRLASNSLLECVVCAYKTAQYLNNSPGNEIFNQVQETLQNIPEVNSQNKSEIIRALRDKLKSTMWENVGIFRSENSLQKALSDINQAENEFHNKDSCSTKEEYELRNMLITSRIIVQCALERKESRGAHYRTDYLQTDKNPKHSEVFIY